MREGASLTMTVPVVDVHHLDVRAMSVPLRWLFAVSRPDSVRSISALLCHHIGGNQPMFRFEFHPFSRTLGLSSPRGWGGKASSISRAAFAAAFSIGSVSNDIVSLVKPYSFNTV